MRKIKHLVREHCGKNLTAKSMQRMVEESGDRRFLLALVALLLGDEEIKKRSTWSVPGRQFLQSYKKELLDYYGFMPGERAKPMAVADPAELIGRMAEMKRDGLFGNESYRRLAASLKREFDLPYSEATLLTKLKEGVR